MRTKRYTVAIAGLMPEIVTQSILIKVWEKAAKKVCASTGIYVNACKGYIGQSICVDYNR